MPNSIPTKNAIASALCHFRVSTGIDVDPDAFASSLMSGVCVPEVMFAVETHLREADPAEIANLVIEGSATFTSLKSLVDRLLPAGHPNREYVKRFVQ